MARWLRKRMKKQEKFNDQLKETAQSANEAIPEVMGLIANVKGMSGGAGAGAGAGAAGVGGAVTKTGSPMMKKYKNPCWENFKYPENKRKKKR